MIISFIIVLIVMFCIFFSIYKKQTKNLEEKIYNKEYYRIEQKIKQELSDKFIAEEEALEKKKAEHEAIKEQIEITKEEIQLKKDELRKVENARNKEVYEHSLLMQKSTYLTNQINKEHQKLNEYQTNERQKIDDFVAELKQQKLQTVEAEMENVRTARLAAIVDEEGKARTHLEQSLKHDEQVHLEVLAQYLEIENEYKFKIEAIKEELLNYEAKQAAVAEAIRRQREVDEQKDFYRICLSDDIKDDISVLLRTKEKLSKPEILDKLIYDSYIAKPVLEMVKRVLRNSTCSGIYKITCLETQEIYVGKSTDIKSRWQQHVKTAFNCGTIASSLLHKKMQQYGVDKFTFELLEEVPKDQLSEREKYYINFYKTKETGLNERNG